MKLFPKRAGRGRLFAAVAVAALGAGVFAAGARGELPSWIRNTEGHSALEAVFFRVMSLPVGDAVHRRPPSETRPELSKLIAQQPKEAELYSLLALEDEQQLDFTAAEANWKKFVDSSTEKSRAQMALADFYERRLRPQEEIQVLSTVANAPALESEKLTPPGAQQSWRAFERIFTRIRQQGLSNEVSIAQYRSWLAHYPRESSLYSRFLDFLISAREFDAGRQLIEDYRKQFPEDEIFAVQAGALVEYRRGALPQGLSVYEKSFRPLWDPQLVKSYFDLLRQTHGLRKFMDQQRAALDANPEDLRATTLAFYYYQQEGKLDAAQAEITRFRMHKESAHSEWSSEELYVCARLLEAIHAYPEAARYYFALYNAPGGAESQERALAGLAAVLFDAPETPIRFGTGELSYYRDIGAMDQGPGYLNGILSLILNTTGPEEANSQEEQRAIPYFHRAQAVKLLALLDAKFPKSSSRPELHAKLIGYFASAGESEAVIRRGRQFLATFERAPQRTQVALEMADAYARTQQPEQEFAIYAAVLKELAAKAQGVPLGSGANAYGQPRADAPEVEAEDEQGNPPSAEGGAPRPAAPAFQMPERRTAAAESGARSPEYSRVLERYLARLAQRKQIPQAIAVLRDELERNPDDPGIYERLALFLDQNRIGAEQEEIYKRAIARFPERSWYHKLARFYLRQKQEAEFAALTQEVVKLFNGTDLESYFRSVVFMGNEPLYLQLNLYAHQRFPHNPVFVNNLLVAYQAPQTRNEAAWEQLLREHWFEEAGLRNRFFSFLSRTGRLEAEYQKVRLDALSKGNMDQLVQQNPAVGEYLAQANLWRSHYEESAPLLKDLAQLYPADSELGHTAAAVFRSLAYYQPAETETAVKIEENLLAANPGSTQLLAAIGDTLADRQLFPRAAPYWNRIPLVSPGETNGYLEAATIYWDYFDFENSLRLLGEARKKFSNPALYAYEVGAIYDNRREFPRAIEEYVNGSLAAGPGSPSESRLLQLARRPALQTLVNNETQKRADEPGAPIAAIALRARVLETIERKKELEALLDAAIARATTLEEAAELESLAQQKSLDSVRGHALEKQAALTSDPVTRLQLRYRLVQLYEARKDLASAQRNIEDLYRENPKILGVVRATVDFFWRVKLYSQAIAVLEQAAKDAYPALATQFTFEAARKSTTAKLFPQARAKLAALLKDSPYDAQYLAAMADTYAQAGDSAGLKQFYIDEIAAFQASSLPPEAKKTQIATLRRGLIPALTSLHDYSGAVDQYIEVLRVFPADEGLAAEAAHYAGLHHLEPRILAYFTKAVEDSPRDERWPVVLARAQVALEDFPAAIDAYGKAIAIRPDRSDLRTARAGLAERLVRFDDAIVDYTKLYDLSYKDPQWMEKIAELRARQGHSGDAVAALTTALITGTAERPDKYFEAARRLESWGLLAEARTFAEQGIHAAGGELLASTDNHTGAALYARLMTRLRQEEAAYSVLQQGLSAASAALPVVEQQVAREGIAAVTDSEWRKRVRESRIQNARNGMRAALVEMGHTAANYFTPEEIATFSQFAQKLREPMDMTDVEFLAIPFAESAGLQGLQAHWLYELAGEQGQPASTLSARMHTYAQFQTRRLRFEELAPQLEQFALQLPPAMRPLILLEASHAWRSAGDEENELRVLSTVSPVYLGNDLNRYFELLLKRNPEGLIQTAANWTPWGEQAAQFAIANGSAELVHRVVAARARLRVPVWKNAYDSLTGLYFAEANPAVNKSFLDALGDETIGQRIGKKLDRNLELAGDIWFYYGSRYGAFLAMSKQGEPEDFFAAVLEQSPASSSGYLQVADEYADFGSTQAAITDYLHVLELSPASVTAHQRLALAYFKQGDRAAAVAQWKLALAQLAKQVKLVAVPESFWSDFALVVKDAATRHAFTTLRPDVDTLLRAYLKKNGTYRSNELLRTVYQALADPRAATAWLLDLSTAAPEPVALLNDVAFKPWIPLAQRAPIYQRILAAKADVAAKATGLEQESAQMDLRFWQHRWVSYLIQTKQFKAAGDFLASLPQETLANDRADFVALQLEIAAHAGTLDAIVSRYRAGDEPAPSADVLRETARRLRVAGDTASARKILEFVFARAIEEHNLEASNFLGLAEIRIAAGDLPGALQLLRRLTVVVENPFTNMDSAAALLEKTGNPAEAADFLAQLVQATPWDATYRLRWAKAKLAAGVPAGASPAPAREALAKIASSVDVTYSVREDAALALASRSPVADLGSKELNLLAAAPSQLTPAGADQPWFYAARIRVAENSTDARAKMQLLRNAVADAPVSRAARYLLFEAAAAAHSDRLAVAALEGTAMPEILSNSRYMQARDDINGTADSVSESESGNLAARLSARREPALSRARQARIAFEAAEVMERLGSLSESLGYLQTARRLEKKLQRRKEIAARIAATKKELDRRATNQARQPILHQALEQDRVVRPRISIAAAAVSPAEQGAKRP